MEQIKCWLPRNLDPMPFYPTRKEIGRTVLIPVPLDSQSLTKTHACLIVDVLVMVARGSEVRSTLPRLLARFFLATQVFLCSLHNVTRNVIDSMLL